MGKEWAGDDTENYEQDLEEINCNDCNTTLGWFLPDVSKTFLVCHSCYYANGDEIKDMKARKIREKEEQSS